MATRDLIEYLTPTTTEDDLLIAVEALHVSSQDRHRVQSASAVLVKSLISNEENNNA